MSPSPSRLHAADSDGRWSLGKYRLIAKLGEGASASVFLAISKGLGDFQKLVVLKVLRSDVSSDPAGVQVFMDEAKLAAQLQHPNIVHTYEVGEEDGRYFIAMEYLEGHTLSVARQELTLEDTPLHVSIISSVLKALDYTHRLKDLRDRELGLVHRDVKPSNVFVTYDGQVKLLDFGIAKSVESLDRTMTGHTKGTVRYMAPEALTEDDLDRRSDIYSVGVMLWEAIAGRELWAGSTELAVMQRVVAGDFPDLREHRPDVAPQLEAITKKALALDPEERFADAGEMASQIDDWLRDRRDESGGPALSSFMDLHFGSDRSAIRRVVETALQEGEDDSLTDFSVGGAFGSTKVRPSGSRAEAPAERATGRGAWIALMLGLVAIAAAAAVFVWIDATRRGERAVATPAASDEVLEVDGDGTALIERPEEPAQTSDEVAGTTEPSTEDPQPAQVRLRFGADPSEATLFLDDQALASNPIELELEADPDATHELRAEAAGYITETRPFVPDSNAEIEISLAPEPPAKSERRRRRIRRTPHKTRTPSTSGDEGSRRRLTIDGRDPWQ